MSKKYSLTKGLLKDLGWLAFTPLRAVGEIVGFKKKKKKPQTTVYYYDGKKFITSYDGKLQFHQKRKPRK